MANYAGILERMAQRNQEKKDLKEIKSLFVISSDSDSDDARKHKKRKYERYDRNDQDRSRRYDRYDRNQRDDRRTRDFNPTGPYKTTRGACFACGSKEQMAPTSASSSSRQRLSGLLGRHRVRPLQLRWRQPLLKHTNLQCKRLQW